MKIEKCPFCGGEAIPCSTGNHLATEKFFVSCGVCGVETPRIARTRKEATAAWNRRVLPENKPLTCEGCESQGKYENEVEYGYPSPCTRCARRAIDNHRYKTEEVHGV